MYRSINSGIKMSFLMIHMHFCLRKNKSMLNRYVVIVDSSTHKMSTTITENEWIRLLIFHLDLHVEGSIELPLCQYVFHRFRSIFDVDCWHYLLVGLINNSLFHQCDPLIVDASEVNCSWWNAHRRCNQMVYRRSAKV